MKIAYFINAYPRVSHTFIRREIQALERLGAEILRVSLRPEQSSLIDPEDIRESALTHQILGNGWGKVCGLALRNALSSPLNWLAVLFYALRLGAVSERGIVAHVAYFLEAISLADLCRRNDIRHIHAHFGTNSATVAMLASRFAGLTFSFTAHGADEIDQARQADMQEKLKQASFIIGVSWFVRSQLMRRMPPGEWEKIKVVHCGLADDFLNASVPAYPELPVFVCLGRLCEEKAQHLLVKAFAKVVQKNQRARLVLAGDGPLRGLVEAEISALGLKDHVTITGWIDNTRVRQELGNARIMVLPSLIEGLPVAIMEAMAMGRPVVSTYVSGIPELVVPGETGFLVPAGDIDRLAEAMLAASRLDTKTIAELGQNARKAVQDRHNVETEAVKLIDLFRSVRQA